MAPDGWEATGGRDPGDADERAMVAERAWSAAKQRGDTRLQAAALVDYREARRDSRRGRSSCHDVAGQRSGSQAETSEGRSSGAYPLRVAMALDNIATDLAVPARTDYRLSAHERELFVLMADGRTFEDAARALGISGHTAKNEASAVYARLGVSGLVEFYAVAGWLRVPR